MWFLVQRYRANYVVSKNSTVYITFIKKTQFLLHQPHRLRQQKGKGEGLRKIFEMRHKMNPM